VADSLNVVAVRVQYIAAVVVGVVPGTKTRRTVVAGTRGESRRVERIDGRTIWRTERNVHRRRGLTFRDEEVNAPRRTEAHSFYLGHFDSKRSERGLIEAPARFDITDGDREVVDERQGLTVPSNTGTPSVMGDARWTGDSEPLPSRSADFPLTFWASRFSRRETKTPGQRGFSHRGARI
jgi:hypothetical protein